MVKIGELCRNVRISELNLKFAPKQNLSHISPLARILCTGFNFHVNIDLGGAAAYHFDL